MGVRKGRNLSWSAVGADGQTAGDPPGIKLPGGLSPTYPLVPDQLDVWDSWRDEPPCYRLRGSVGPFAQPTYRLGLEPRVVAGRGHFFGPGQQLFSWVHWRRDIPNTYFGAWNGQSLLSSGFLGGVWIGDKFPLPRRYQRWQERQ